MTFCAAAGPQEPQGGAAFATLEWPGDVRDLPAAATSTPYAIAAAAVLLLVVVAFVARRRRSGAAAGPEAPVVPVATALARLRALVVPNGADGVEAFYLAVKDVLRVHAHERFGVRAFVATSEELCVRVPPHADLDDSLRACDAVLFGAACPEGSAHRQVLARAEAWLVASAGVAA
ncbi:MAG: hypothetical protein JNK15_10170 [Planctomycetes bacterium]|nr:hypothetical protein [Planctomycetota bacterium]